MIGLILFFLFIAGLTGCSFSTDERKIASFPEKLCFHGFLRVKITSDTAALIAHAKSKNDTLALLGLSESLRTLEIRNLRIERTFPYAGELEEYFRKMELHLWYDIYYDDIDSK